MIKSHPHSHLHAERSVQHATHTQTHTDTLADTHTQREQATAARPHIDVPVTCRWRRRSYLSPYFHTSCLPGRCVFVHVCVCVCVQQPTKQAGIWWQWISMCGFNRKQPCKMFYLTSALSCVSDLLSPVSLIQRKRRLFVSIWPNLSWEELWNFSSQFLNVL